MRLDYPRMVMFLGDKRASRRLVWMWVVGLALSGCAGLDRDDQGVLQPQTVRGPCNVKKFYLLSRTAVHTDLVARDGGEACTFTVLNPALQAFPTAVIVSQPPLHGSVTGGLTNGGRSAIVSYLPQAGYVGADRFTVTIEPDDHAIAVAVTSQPGLTGRQIVPAP